jgi:hypothetical protein
MQRIHLKPDDLDEQNRRFEQQPIRQAVFLNSVPKSGSHLLRNIVRMFVPVEQQYQADFIQYATLKRHMPAFDPAKPQLSWGHLLFSDISATATSQARRLLLVRDPYSWVIAKARFMLSGEFSGDLDYLKTAPLTPDELINLTIFGIHTKNPSLRDTFTHNAAAWLGTPIYLVRFEELVEALRSLEDTSAEVFFGNLLEACGIEVPGDWRERVRIGADPRRSGTARENLSGVSMRLPDKLSDAQKRLVDFASPGLRALLGYEQAR